MAKETEVVKVYPSDEAVRQKIKLFESFGWEVVGNQKITDKVGSYEGADGNYYDRLETYIQLTFSREKSSSWYKEIVELEKAYYAESNAKERMYAEEPKKPKYVTFFGVLLVFTPLLPITLPLLIINIVRQVKGKKAYKKAHDEWVNKKYSVQDQVARKQEEILKKASELL